MGCYNDPCNLNVSSSWGPFFCSGNSPAEEDENPAENAEHAEDEDILGQGKRQGTPVASDLHIGTIHDDLPSVSQT